MIFSERPSSSAFLFDLLFAMFRIAWWLYAGK